MQEPLSDMYVPRNYHKMVADFKAIEAGTPDKWEEHLPPEELARYKADPTIYDPPEPPKGFWDMAWETTKDFVRAPVHGTTRAVEGVGQVAYDTLNFFDDYLGLDALPKARIHLGSDYWEPVSPVGHLASAGIEFATLSAATGGAASLGVKALGTAANSARAGSAAQYVLTNLANYGSKALSAASNGGPWAKFAAETLKGAVVDGVFQDPGANRFSDLIQQFPELQNPITEYLASDPNDSEMDARLKNVLEGAALGGAMELFLLSLAKGMRWYNHTNKLGLSGRKIEKNAERYFREADEYLKKAAEETPEVFEKLTPEQVAAVVGNAADGVWTGADNAAAPTAKAAAEGTPEAAAKTMGAKVDDGLTESMTIRTDPMPGGTAAKAASEIPATGVPDMDVPKQADFIENLRAKIVRGEQPSEFVKTSSIYNAEHLSNEERLLFDTVSEVMGHERDFHQTNTLSREVVRERAQKWLEDWYRSKGVTNKIDALFRDFSEVGDALPYAVENAQGYISALAERTVEVVHSFDGLSGEALAKALADDGDATLLLIEFQARSLQMDRLSTGVARGLNQFNRKSIRTLADFDSLKKGLSYAEALEDAKQSIKKLSPSERIETLRTMSTIDSPARQAAFLRETWGKKAWEITNEYWLNAVLSGPRTHIVNLVSNLLKVGVMMPVERMVGAGVDRLLRGQWTQESRGLWNEGVKAYAAMRYTVRDAWAMAKKSFEMGDNLLKPQQSVMEYMRGKRRISAKYMGMDPTGGLGKAINSLGTAINMPTRFLMASDEFFSQLTYRSTIFTNLYTQAEELFERGILKAAGGHGDKEAAIRDFITNNFDVHFGDALHPDTGALMKGVRGTNTRALNNSMEATFTQELPKGTLSRTLQDAAAKHPAFKRIAPFIRTPVNILKDAQAHSPFALATGDYWRAVQKGGRDAMLANAKLGIGSLICVTAGMYAMEGNITGGGPRNAKAREALLETGWRPYSIKVGNTYVSYDRIEPFGSVLGMIADFNDLYAAWQEEDPESEDKSMAETMFQLGAAMACSLTRSVSSKSYTQGISELLSALDNPEAMGEAYFKNFALSYMAPALLSQSRKIFDPEIREVKTFMEEFINRMPGLSSTLPAKYSWLTGEPVKLHGGIQAGFMPVLIETGKTSRVADELLKFPRAVLGPAKDIGGVTLDGQQASDYARLHGTVKIGGKTLMQALENLMNSASYDYDRKVTPDTKEMLENKRYTLIQRVVQQYRDAAKQALFREHPDLRDRVLRKNKGDRNAGVALARSNREPTARETAYQKAQRKIKEGGF